MSASTDSSQSHAAEPGKQQFSLRFVFAVVTTASLALGMLRWFGPPDAGDALWVLIEALMVVVQTAAVATIVQQSKAARAAVMTGGVTGAGLAFLAFGGPAPSVRLIFWVAFGATLGAWYFGGFIAALDDRTRFLRYALLLACTWTLLLIATALFAFYKYTPID
ncbi:MAG TPA: hypothetical protein VJ783_13860 [Pirellulales bacterium]|nr:hypothetical protein [Pirellulales bacterium]